MRQFLYLIDRSHLDWWQLQLQNTRLPDVRAFSMATLVFDSLSNPQLLNSCDKLGISTWVKKGGGGENILLVLIAKYSCKLWTPKVTTPESTHSLFFLKCECKSHHLLEPYTLSAGSWGQWNKLIPKQLLKKQVVFTLLEWSNFSIQ